MGSNRNKKNHRNNHRHVFRKRKSPFSKKIQPGLKENSVNQASAKSVMVNDKQDTNKTVTTIDGSRIMNVDKMKKYTDEIALHAARCEGSIILKVETRFGLASILTWHCSKCTHRITLESSPKVKVTNKYTRWECNLAAVWGHHGSFGNPSYDKDLFYLD